MYRFALAHGPGTHSLQLCEKELNNAVNLFDALMNAAWIDKDTILIPQFVDCRTTTISFKSKREERDGPISREDHCTELVGGLQREETCPGLAPSQLIMVQKLGFVELIHEWNGP
jgi:hypothetical protein